MPKLADDYTQAPAPPATLLSKYGGNGVTAASSPFMLLFERAMEASRNLPSHFATPAVAPQMMMAPYLIFARELVRGLSELNAERRADRRMANTPAGSIFED